MPRRKLSAPEIETLVLRKRTFGLWLRGRRVVRGFSQKEAAKAVKVHKLTWIRWEHGRSKVPYGQLLKIANALRVVPRRRIFTVAGYEAPRTLNDAPRILKHVHEVMVDGDLQAALEQLLLLYERIRPDRIEFDTEIDGSTPVDFANAVVYLDVLPMWLSEKVLRCMNNRQNEYMRNGEPGSLRSMVLDSVPESIFNECINELMITPPIVKPIPYDPAGKSPFRHGEITVRLNPEES